MTRTLAQLLAAQRAHLRLDGGRGLASQAACAAFLAQVGIALRYGATDKLALASLYAAVGDDRRATRLANALIDDGLALEVTCVGDRVALAHASLAPALIALCRRRAGDLSDTARDVLGFIAATPRATAGAVRAYLRVPPRTWPNVADDALAELQRALVVDRGATDVPETGAAYLSKDGIPYRLVDEAHAAHVAAAAALDPARAGDTLVLGYLRGAVFAAAPKLRALFKRCLAAAEVTAAVARLADAGDVTLATIAGKPYVTVTARAGPRVARRR